jgi:hypothetical protein
MTVTVELREQPRGAGCCAEVLPVRLSAEAAQQFSDDLQILVHPIWIQILDILGRPAGQAANRLTPFEVAAPGRADRLRASGPVGLLFCPA